MSSKSFIYILSLSLLTSACVEEIDLNNELTTNIESSLVIEATITNEIKTQKILLSRTSLLDEEFFPKPESNATVAVIGSDSSVFSFVENEHGLYESTVPFNAVSGVEYQLEITTDNGFNYGSSKMQLTQSTLIEKINVEREININNEEEVVISINAVDPTGNSRYYRFEYEETYKILSPLYFPLELIPHDVIFPIPPNTINLFNTPRIVDLLVEIQYREEQEIICYNTVKSNSIILANTVDLLDDKLVNFKVRYINKSDYIIAHRYSILVKQYVQSREAYSYYETLKSFSDSEDVFSENQTGFIEGNVFSVNNNNENVIGFFEVSSVDKQRVFFNYQDLFDEESLNPYYTRCDQFWQPPLLEESADHEIIRSPLLDLVNQGFQLYDLDFNPAEQDYFFHPYEEGPFTLVLGHCGDCTVLGTNKQPDFWRD